MNDIDALEQQAVDAAITQHWNDALRLNEKILKLDSKNLAACLRLGFIYMQMKDFTESKKYYQKGLRIQPKNHVAQENLERLDVLGEKSGRKSTGEKTILNPNLFLEVPGKTKTVVLVNIGQKKDLAELVSGQKVELKLKKRKVEARTNAGKYIGSLPDDISKRLIYFIKAKSNYAAFVKESSINRVIIFIKEESKGKKVSHYSSFPQNSQANMDKIQDNSSSESEEHDETDEDEWDNITHELSHEEKEEIIDIHHEEEAEE